MEEAPTRGKCHYSEIDAHALTEGHADVAAHVPALLGQADGQLTSATAMTSPNYFLASACLKSSDT
jgi:hypothetical protein